MGSHTLPSPPAEDAKAALSRKSTSSSKSSSKSVHRISKRAGSTAGSVSHPQHHHDSMHPNSMDGRHKRVWKACERCRMKKTKCDGEFPCKRCKDDGLVCTAGVRKKMEYKQLPKGYAEVLENTQFALIATVHKLYAMLRANQTWDLGEPELNDRGQPVIHNIAQKLGTIRPNSDIDLPVHSVFPEDERGMRELAIQLEEQQQYEDVSPAEPISATSVVSPSNGFQRADSSELDHSEFETDYRAAAFGRSNVMTMSPQSFTTSNTDYEFGPASDDMMFPTPPEPAAPKMSSHAQQQQQQQQHQQLPSPPIASFQNWHMAPPMKQGMTMGYMQPQNMALQNIDLLAPEMQERLMNQGLVESEFGTLKPHVLSGANSEVMMGMGDPMIFSGIYDGDL